MVENTGVEQRQDSQLVLKHWRQVKLLYNVHVFSCGLLCSVHAAWDKSSVILDCMVYRHCCLCTVFSDATNKICISFASVWFHWWWFCVFYHCLPHSFWVTLSHSISPFTVYAVWQVYWCNFTDVWIIHVMLHFCEAFAFNILFWMLVQVVHNSPFIYM